MTPLLVKILGILCTNKIYMMIGLMIFLIYLTQLIILFKILLSWMMFVKLELSWNCAKHVTAASYKLLITIKYVT